MHRCTLFIVAALCIAATVAQAPAKAPAMGPAGSKAPLPMNRPLIFAHRGLSGPLPEHTLEAYCSAIEEGADFVEVGALTCGYPDLCTYKPSQCDVVMTKDCQLVCRHEPNISNTTNADEIFPNLIKNYTVDGVNERGVFTNDLTLDQIKQLTARQRVYIRDQSFNNAGFKVPTVREYLELLSNAPRVVGAVPETKHPTFFDSLNLKCMNGSTFTDLLADILSDYGYDAPYNTPAWRQRPVLVQSFEIDNLKQLNATWGIPAYQLIDDVTGYTADKSNKSYRAMMTPEGLKDIATYAVIVAPWKNNIVPAVNNTIPAASVANGKSFQANATKAGLGVNTWTFRDEPNFLASNYSNNPQNELTLFLKDVGVQGLFTDNTTTAVQWLKSNGYTPAAVSRPAPAPGPAAVAAAGAGPAGPATPYKLSSSCSRFPKAASKS